MNRDKQTLARNLNNKSRKGGWTEAKASAKFLAAARKNEWNAARIETGMTCRGVPDIYLWSSQGVMWVEMKAGLRKVDLLQQQFIDKHSDVVGCTAAVVRAETKDVWKVTVNGKTDQRPTAELAFLFLEQQHWHNSTETAEL